MFIFVKRFWAFYRKALTKYQIHSPRAFELAQCILEDKRRYYAFPEIRYLHRQMLKSQSFVGQQTLTVAQRTRNSDVRPGLGQKLFRLILLLQPRELLCANPGSGLSLLYAGTAVRSAGLCIAEADKDCANLTRLHAEMLGLQSIHDPNRAQPSVFVVQYGQLDFKDIVAAFLEKAPLESCLIVLNPHRELHPAWEALAADSRFTLTLDFWDIALAFKDPRFAAKQYFSIVPAWWKLWKFM